MAKLRYTPLDRLKPWESNYRRGDVDAIQASIERFGFNGALRTRGRIVMAGNHALQALQRMLAAGGDPPAGIRVQGSRWLVPVIEMGHLTEAEAIAFAVADNRTHDLGSHDEAALSDLMRSLEFDSHELAEALSLSDREMIEYGLRPPPEAAPTDPAVRPGEFPSVTDLQTEYRCPMCAYEWSGSPK